MMVASNLGTHMHRRFTIILLAFLAAASPAAAQDLLPATFSGWTTAAPPVKVGPEALEQFAGAHAAILREDGAQAGERRSYTRGSDILTVTVYRMRDPTGAYAAYTFLRADEMAPADLTRYSAVGREDALAVQGNLLIAVAGLRAASLAEIKSLVTELGQAAEKATFPTLGELFPPRGFVRHSERYLLGPEASRRTIPLGNGDWIGFADGAEAQLAQYHLNGQEATLLLAVYPTPQGAARKMEELGRWFSLNPAQEAAVSSQPPIFVRRQGPLLALVAYTRSAELARSLLDQVHYETQITWNEPSHTLTDPTWGEIIVGTFVGTGLILLFALVAGIGFGGVRIIVKYFLPGKVFDRPGHVEILQLGLTSKPIEAKDFY